MSGNLVYYENDLPKELPYSGKLDNSAYYLVRIDGDGTRWLLRRAP